MVLARTRFGALIVVGWVFVQTLPAISEDTPKSEQAKLLNFKYKPYDVTDQKLVFVGQVVNNSQTRWKASICVRLYDADGFEIEHAGGGKVNLGPGQSDASNGDTRLEPKLWGARSINQSPCRHVWLRGFSGRSDQSSDRTKNTKPQLMPSASDAATNGRVRITRTLHPPISARLASVRPVPPWPRRSAFPAPQPLLPAPLGKARGLSPTGPTGGITWPRPGVPANPSPIGRRAAKRRNRFRPSWFQAGITPGLYAVRLGGGTMSAVTFRA